MEYNIYSSDQNTNEVILAALNDLENTFFVEHSDSEESSISDNDNNEEILEINDDISLDRLNKFEFVEVPENYIEDKVYDDLKFLARRAEFESLDKNMKDMVIKGQLMAFQKNEVLKKVSNKKYSRFRYCYNNSIQVCHDTYFALVEVGHTYLETIIKHLREHGLEERTHGNTGRAPKNMNHVEVNYSVACDIFKFLKNYLDIHGMPLPGRHFKEISMPIVFLPTSYNYALVYRDYVQAAKGKYGKDVRVIAESTFTNIWKALIPSLQFMSPKSDLCETCEMMKMDIQYATQHERKLELTENYLAHLNHAQKERNYYNNNIVNVVEDGKRNQITVESQVSFKTFEGIAHITYNWAQNVQIPYSPQQVGTLYFKSPQKVHLFGVCNTGNFPNAQQTNYVIDEAKMPDDGKQEKR
ncbi:chaperonin: PROVISIONAL [Gigaspora margarita]|uniref:Chaperonin: PROVISIONAL n=1 Tax=Gigaspora margarita TaxID=4874 RepID=A0A8H3X297_GIGMA|nr:chaperonin: PROVISIONAL [Gigaspora margarita]